MSDSALILAVGVAAIIIASRRLADRFAVPAPVLLVLFGVVAGLVPWFPSVQLDPDLVFYGFLPALVYYAGFLTAPRETKQNAVPIAALAVGLVILTAAVVAVVVHLAIGLGWGPSFVLGAVVAPTDPVAATAVLKRVGAPRHITTILEGESLVNDAVALTLLVVAIDAVGPGFSLASGVGRFVLEGAGGIAYGLAVAWLIDKVRRGIDDVGGQIVVSIVTPYLAYVPADRLHLSGVLATVTAGFFLGTRTQGLLQAASRLQAVAFWDTLSFLLESSLFVLLGLQFQSALDGIEGRSTGQVALACVAAVLAVVASRIAWELVVPPVFAALRGIRRGDVVTRAPLRERGVIAWAGVRGAVSYAAALTVPVTVAGAAFPDRNLIIFLTIVVVLFTLVGQATTLPVLLRRLGMAGPGAVAAERRVGERAMVNSALETLAALQDEEEVPGQAVHGLQHVYAERKRRLDADEGTDFGTEPSSADVRRRILQAQRAVLDALYRSGEVGTEVVRSLRRELDVEERRLRD